MTNNALTSVKEILNLFIARTTEDAVAFPKQNSSIIIERGHFHPFPHLRANRAHRATI